MERYPVDALFRQLHGVKTDAADLVALLLHGDVEPILLLHSVALSLVVTGGVSLVGLFFRGEVESFTQDDSTRRASGGGERIAARKFVAEICAARAERGVGNGARDGAAREQADDEHGKQDVGGVDFQFCFHKR